MNRKKLTTAVVAIAVAGTIVIYWLKPPTNESGTGIGIGVSDPARAPGTSQPEPQPERDPADMTIRFDEINPSFKDKPIPDLATWRYNSPYAPPTGKHMEKLVRYSLKEVLGVELPASATEFHFAGAFRIPLDDFQPFLDDFLSALELDPMTLEYTGSRDPALQFNYVGNDRFHFTSVRPRRLKSERAANRWRLPLSKGTISVSFVERASNMKFSYLLDPKTGNCKFAKGRYDD